MGILHFKKFASEKLLWGGAKPYLEIFVFSLTKPSPKSPLKPSYEGELIQTYTENWWKVILRPQGGIVYHDSLPLQILNVLTKMINQNQLKSS